MASHLASIYGTEHDKVNCSFYNKIGACRHGDKCSRKHVHPSYSQTILCPNLYRNPALREGNGPAAVDERQVQEDFNKFYADIYCELAKYGELEALVVCDNIGDHLVGNVYARFTTEEEAQRAVDAVNSRWYAGRPVYAELSPVTDFQEACCRQHDTGDCRRGGVCNFMHTRKPDPAMDRQLFLAQKKSILLKTGKTTTARSPSPSPPPTGRLASRFG